MTKEDVKKMSDEELQREFEILEGKSGNQKKNYCEDDRFEIPEEIKNLSEGELQRRIWIYEEHGRRERKNIPKPILRRI